MGTVKSESFWDIDILRVGRDEGCYHSPLGPVLGLDQQLYSRVFFKTKPAEDEA